MDTSDIIMLTIVGVFLLFVLLGAYLYETMTPEEKKKWEEEEQLRRYRRKLNWHCFWYDFYHDSRGPTD